MVDFEARPTIVVSHASALSALRDERMRFGRIRWEPISIEEQRHVLSTTRPSVHTIDEIELLRIGALSPYAPLEALVGSKTQRTRNPELCVHSVTSKLPSGALLRVQPDLYIVSPVFAVTQCAARSKSLPATLALIYKLCGSFTMPESLEDQLTHPRDPVASEDRPTYQEAEPALTLADLKIFLKAASSVYGSSLARKAADQALEGARSPMEAISSGMYHTAQPLGGFGIKTILLNHRIDFNEIARAASSLSYAVCDAYIPDAKSTLEYNGSDHDSHSQRVHDERRAAGLSAMGVHTISLNDHTLRDMEALEAIARTLYRFANKRYRNRSKGYRVRQLELLNGLRQAYGLKLC